MIKATVYTDKNLNDQRRSKEKAVRNGASYIHLSQRGSNFTRNYVNPDTVNKNGYYKSFKISY